MEVCFGNLQLPGLVMDFAAVEAAAWVGAVEAIALGQEMLEGSGFRLENFRYWTIIYF